jgi:CheY-like chemotaxis protein
MRKAPFFLLVEDDEDDRFFFLETLRSIDPAIQSMVAINGKEALTLLNNDFFSLPDYIFLDLNMPLMNGLKCLEEIRKIPALKQIPVIIYSTTSEKEVEEKSRSSGAFSFFIKPSSQAELADYIRKIIAV